MVREGKIKKILFVNPDSKERIDKETPLIIKELCFFPYQWVQEMNLTGSFLDVGCGEENFGSKLFNCTSIDIARDLDTDYIQADAQRLPFLNRSFDYITLFETIEHIKEQRKVINELVRVARRKVFVGSINKDGPNFIDGIEIYKGTQNPYHLKELGIAEFKDLFRDYPKKSFYHSVYDGEFKMKLDLSPRGYCNYVIVEVR